MFHYILPNITDKSVSQISKGAQSLALLMIRNMLYKLGHEGKLWDEYIEPFDTDMIEPDDTVFLSINYLNLQRAKVLIEKTIAVGASVVIGGPALETTKGNYECLGIPKHSRLMPIYGGWAAVFSNLLKYFGNQDISVNSWNDLSSYQMDRISLEDLERRTKLFHQTDFCDFHGQYVNIHSQVGCRHRMKTGGCGFCSRHFEYYSGMTPAIYVDLLRHLYREWDVGFVWDSSDDFFESPESLRAIIDKGIEELAIDLMIFARVDTITPLSASLLKQCGVKYAIVGVESGSDAVLKRANKGITAEQAYTAINDLTNAGISSIPCFTIGHPGETKEDVKNTYALAQSLVKACDITAISCSPIMPIPGSEYHKTAKLKLQADLALSQREYFTYLSIPITSAYEYSREIELVAKKTIAIWGRN